MSVELESSDRAATEEVFDPEEAIDLLLSHHGIRVAHDARLVAVDRRLLQPVPAVGIAFEIVFAALVVYVPVLQHVFGTAALGPEELAVLLVFPVIVWGSDELRRWRRRRRDAEKP